MNARNSFIATASGVVLTLTALVAEAANSDPLFLNALSGAQDSKIQPSAVPVPGLAQQTAGVAAPTTPLQAKVIDCVGKVRWRAGPDVAWKDANDAKLNDLLSAGAEVRTSLRSRMTLKFDNATVLIDSNSNFAMPTVELVKENDGDVYRTIALMKSGRADFQVDKVGAKNDFKVVTPGSTLAVRGTGFSVMTGAMTGTEVVGARTNAIAAIQLKYAATNQTVVMSGGGEAKSSSASPEPATGALLSSIGGLPMVGTATSAAEHEVSASMGTTQTTAQTQATNTIAAVAAAVHDNSIDPQVQLVRTGSANALLLRLTALQHAREALMTFSQNEGTLPNERRLEALAAAVSAIAAANAALEAGAQSENLTPAQQIAMALAIAAAQNARDAAKDSLVGMDRLSGAITAMLHARTFEGTAHAEQQAAEAFRDLAVAKNIEATGEAAQEDINRHRDAVIAANDAQTSAQEALSEALVFLQDAVDNSESTTQSAQSVLMALNDENLEEAGSAENEARDSADAAIGNAGDARASADAASGYAGVAGSQISISADVQHSFEDRLTAIQAALAAAHVRADAAATAASASSNAAGIAQTFGNLFAAQFAQTDAAGTAAAQAVSPALAHAFNLAVSAAQHAQNAEQLAIAAGSALNGVIDANGNPVDAQGVLINFSATSAAAQLAAAQAAASDNAALEAARLAAIANAEAVTANKAVQTLFHKINTNNSATYVETRGAQVAGLAGQIDNAIQTHDEALQGAVVAASVASGELATSLAQRSNSEVQLSGVHTSFSEMIVAMGNLNEFGSGNANLALYFSQMAVEQAGAASVAANLAHSAAENAGIQDQLAAGFVATSNTQEIRAQDALAAAQGLLPGMNDQSAAAGQSALASFYSATAAGNAALFADTEIAQALADRALALSVAALERAIDALAARNTALDQLAMASSAIQQASFQQTAYVAAQVHVDALAANVAALDALAFANSATSYGNLADSTARAFSAGADAFAFRVDSDIALSNTIFSRDSASQAIDIHNQALATVSSLFTSAGVSLNETESQMNFAIGFAGDAAFSYGETQVAYNAGDIVGTLFHALNTDGSATQSELASFFSNASAVETDGYAVQALLQVPISAQAGINYSDAVAAANGFAAAAGAAHDGAVGAAAQALTFSQAASNFAQAIGSAQATTAANFAIAARDQAISQRAGALASQAAALDAANSASSMGERVFFNRTAEIAADTVARADQARIFADQAIAASVQARNDATSAMGLVNGPPAPPPGQ